MLAETEEQRLLCCESIYSGICSQAFQKKHYVHLDNGSIRQASNKTEVRCSRSLLAVNQLEIWQ
jgi:hypothetical protein